LRSVLSPPAARESNARPPAVEPGPSRLAARLFLVSVVVALVPIAVATARAVHRGWLPVGDNAYFAIRAHDVLTADPPLLGTGSSASLSSGTDINNPGPLLFDLLALPVRVADGGAGLAVGVALLNGLSVLGVAILAHRRGGPLLATAAMAAAAALCWAMGSQLLFEPWQPHSLVLPFLCFLMLVWSITCGDLVALPWAAGVGSLLLQTHLSYAFLVPALGAWAVLGLVLALRRDQRRDPGSWPRRRRRALRAGAVAGLVLAVCWAQPLVEQFTSDGEGNLTRLVTGVNDPAQTIGYDLGARLVASVVSLPPWWFRPSFGEAFLLFEGWQPPSLGLAAASSTVLAAVLVWCVWDARRRRDRVSSLAVATAVVALVVGLATAGRGPFIFAFIAPHVLRWLWPIGAFVSFAVVVTLARRLGRRPVRASWLSGTFALVTAVFAALNLPTSNQAQGPSADEWSIPVIRELGRQMTVLEGRGPLLVDLEGAGFDDPYGVAVMAELQRRGVPFLVGEPALVRQLGPARRFTGANARAVLFVRIGDDTRVAPPGARRAAIREGLTPREQTELSTLKARIADYVGNGRLHLTRRGEEVLRRLHPEARQEPRVEDLDPEVLFESRALVTLAEADLLALDDEWARRFHRYADLQDRWDEETVALFLGPVDNGAKASSTTGLRP
jgi:hypothetical protein